MCVGSWCFGFLIYSDSLYISMYVIVLISVQTNIGEKAVEVGNKVVHDNIEELKKEIAESQSKELPELLWEEVSVCFW